MRVQSLVKRFSAMEWIIVVYVLLNAALYASLLPLWEGFDEPFHYGLVREYGRMTGLPVLGRTALDGEVAASLKLAPISHILKRNLGGGITFDEYFRLDTQERGALRAKLAALKPGLPGGGANYEAQQSPLAYVVMAAADRLSGDAPLPARVWRLRMFAALLSALGSAIALIRLAAVLDMSGSASLSAAFLVLSGQMFYATTAHVANDWLVVPLFLLTAASGAALLKEPTTRRGVVLCACLAAALLTKASMLAAAPWVLLILIVRLPFHRAVFSLWPLLIAAPWYMRNIALYRNLSGMHEFASRSDGTSPLSVAPLVPWLDAAWHMARSAVWTGNNSFTSFSRDLTAALLILAASGVVAAVWQDWKQRMPANEGLLWPLAGFLAASLGYAVAVSFWFTRGAAFSAGAWYVQPLSLLLSVLLCAALARAGAVGRVVMAAAVLLSAYVMILTWWVKLVPLYSAMPGVRGTLPGIIDLYRNSGAELASRLSETAMIPATPIFVLAAISSLLALGLAVHITISLRRG